MCKILNEKIYMICQKGAEQIEKYNTINIMKRNI